LQLLTRAAARTFSQVRLVGEGTNEMVSINEAFLRADKAGLDLVLVSDKSNPPVVKIEDYKKILYEEKKAKSKQGKTSDVKEIQLKINIAEHDLQTKLNAIQRFLERGDKVKVSVRLKGRERENPERAHQLLAKVAERVPNCRMSRVPGPIAIGVLETAK